jgi:hypothetical protein
VNDSWNGGAGCLQMKELTQSLLRHSLTYLAGLVVFLQAGNFLTTNDAAKITGATVQITELSTVIAGLLGAAFVRVLISKLSGGGPTGLESEKGGGVNSLLLCVLTVAGLGTALPPCATADFIGVEDTWCVDSRSVDAPELSMEEEEF